MGLYPEMDYFKEKYRMDLKVIGDAPAYSMSGTGLPARYCILERRLKDKCRELFFRVLPDLN